MLCFLAYGKARDVVLLKSLLLKRNIALKACSHFFHKCLLMKCLICITIYVAKFAFHFVVIETLYQYSLHFMFVVTLNTVNTISSLAYTSRHHLASFLSSHLGHSFFLLFSILHHLPTHDSFHFVSNTSPFDHAFYFIIHVFIVVVLCNRCNIYTCVYSKVI